MPKQLEGVDPERRRRRRTALLLSAALFVALLALAAWTGWQVYAGASSLQLAADRLEGLSTDLTDDTDLLGQLRVAAADTEDARDRFEDPFVRLAKDLPIVGTPLQSASVLAISADTAVREAALPLAEAAGDKPASRIIGEGGSVDLPYLTSLAGPASVASATLASAEQALKAAPRRSGVARLDRARQTLSRNLESLSGTVRALAITSDIGPELLGQSEAKTYFVGIQNPAEARGTGGLVGGFVILNVDNGIVRVTTSGSNAELEGFRGNSTVPVANFGPEYAAHYGYASPTSDFVNSNLSPHFPNAAQVWAGLWQRQSRQPVNGVLALDPIALSYILRATGPIPLSDGSRASADNVVDLTMRDVYRQFDNASGERKEYLQEVTRGVAAAITDGKADAGTLVRGLVRGASERRALLWSPEPRVQELLGDAPLSGALPAEPAIGDVIVNSGGSKLDYYLERTLIYTPGCEQQPSRLALRLRNDAPTSGLPRYVTIPQFSAGFPVGTNVSTVTLYVPGDSIVQDVSVDGSNVRHRTGQERGLRWVEVIVQTKPQDDIDVSVTFRQATAASASPARIEQPLVRPERFEMRTC